MAAESGSSITEILQCSICLETFKNPKVLPCIHTFCFQCLRTFCKDNQHEHACPLCRKAFFLPVGGIQDLPTNFFINQLMHARQLKPTSAGIKDKTTVCELCIENEVKTTATAYCIECEQYICERHSDIHKSKKLSKNHQILTLEEKGVPSAEEQVVRTQQLKDDIKKLETCTFQSKKKIELIETGMKRLIDMVDDTENRISQKYDQVLALIESHRTRLLDELDLFKDKKLEELEKSKDNEETLFLIIESLKSYCLDIDKKEMASDISAKDLHSRTEECVKAQETAQCNEPKGIDITFVPSHFTVDAVENFIGRLSFQENGFMMAGVPMSSTPMHPPPAASNYYMQQYASLSFPPPPFYGRNPRAATPRWPNRVPVQNSGSMPPFMNNVHQMRHARPMVSQPAVYPTYPGPPQFMPQQMQVVNPIMRGMPPGMPPRPTYKFNPPTRNLPRFPIVGSDVIVAVAGQEPLTANMLSDAPPQEQKQMLGERLFPLINSMYPYLAGKITGMLLEIDNVELLQMVESREALRIKVEEAVAVLQAHHAKEIAGDIEY